MLLGSILEVNRYMCSVSFQCNHHVIGGHYMGIGQSVTGVVMSLPPVQYHGDYVM